MDYATSIVLKQITPLLHLMHRCDNGAICSLSRAWARAKQAMGHGHPRPVSVARLHRSIAWAFWHVRPRTCTVYSGAIVSCTLGLGAPTVLVEEMLKPRCSSASAAVSFSDGAGGAEAGGGRAGSVRGRRRGSPAGRRRAPHPPHARRLRRRRRRRRGRHQGTPTPLLRIISRTRRVVLLPAPRRDWLHQ